MVTVAAAPSEVAVAAPLGPPGVIDKIAYGLGSIAFGVKDNGFSYLLLLFYNQALGLSAKSVGLAIMIALIVDAVADPFIGNWSDHLRSRLGRRHLLMYAAALPVAVSYYFLWNPPAGMRDAALLAYLLVVSIVIRVFISVYEVPSSALVADLTNDYDERTSFLTWRYFFGWFGGLTVGIAAFSVFLRPSAHDPSGQLNLAGYSNYGLTASLIMFAAIVISSLGTQRRAAAFPLPPPRPAFDLRRSLGEVVATLANRPFLCLMGAGLFSFSAVGIEAAILNYFRIYYWELSGDQISFLMVGNFASIFAALFLAPKYGAYFGKKRATVLLYLFGIPLMPLLVVLRLFDLLPPNHSATLYWLLFASSFVNTVVAITGGILFSAMVADVVEDSARTTGRHSAGLFFAANAFLLKALSGVGIFGTGLILDAVGFPAWAKQGQVPAAVLTRLGIAQPIVIVGLYGVALVFIMAYGIDRRRHAANLAALARPDVAVP